MPTTQLLDNSMELQKDLYGVKLTGNDIVRTRDLRVEYAKTIAAAPFLDEARADEIVATAENEPIFKPKKMHAEDLPQRKDLIQIATDVSIDIAAVDYQIIDAANKYTGLIAGTINRINAIKTRIQRNKERLEDINFITDAYKGLGDSIIITPDMCSGKFTEQDGTFSAYCPYSAEEIQQEITVLSVEGNGYVGNNHVLTSDDKYKMDTDDRSKLENLTDSSPLTVFEYSRICSKDVSYYQAEEAGEDGISTTYDVNNDNKDVSCTITLANLKGEGINMIRFDTPGQNIKIQDVLISGDNIRFRSVLKSEIDFRTDMYHATNYIPGNNVISFPTAAYVKLVLSSDYVEPGEILGYDKIELDEGTPRTVIRRLNNAVRKVIQIGGINAYLCEYTSSSLLTEDIAPAEGCKTIAVFANEYIPYGMNNGKPVKYELHVNGKQYDVVPINSDQPGTKMISCTESKFENTSVEFIDEKIKTVQLRVNFNCSADMTPFVGNLKLCVG